MTTIRIHHITPSSYVDGPGRRAVVWLQGCSIRCPGCQNRALWPEEGGKAVRTGDLARTLSLLNGEACTVTGGEAFDQVEALAKLVKLLRSYGINNLIVYTGYTWGQLRHSPAIAPFLDDILENIDILVDGPFIPSEDDDYVAWRGSANQQVIDVPATLAAGSLVTLDWDMTLQITPAGDLVMPAGMAGDFSNIGSLAHSRRCGQVGA